MFKSSTVDVLIIYGQSQAEGTSRKSDLSEDYIRTGKNVYIWNPSTSAVELLNVGADGVAGNHRWPDGEDLDTYFGPELGIMHYWEARYPERELVIFKWAIGGRPLLKGSGLLSDKGCFDPPEEELFRMFKRDWGRFVEFMSSLNHSVRVIGVDRAQGESDTIYTLSNPGEYLAALRREKAEMVEMFNQPDLKMVLMLPNTYNSGEYQVIQEQFDFAISDQNVGIATARQVPVYGADENAISWDGVHFGADIMIYEAFKTMRVLDAMRIGGISAPDAVSGLASTDVQADEISISWTGTDEEYMVVLNGKVQICTDQTSYTFSGLTSGTIYTVRVYSRSLDWQVSYSELQILTPGGSNIFSVMLANAPSEAAAISGYQAMHTLLEANKPTEITNATAGTIGATQLDDYNLPYCLLGDNSVEFADRMGGKDGINLFVEDAQGYVTHYIGMHGAGGSAKLFIHTFPSALIQNLDYSGGWGSAERIDIPGLTNREYEFLQRCAVDSTTGYVYGMDTADTSSLYGTVLKRFNVITKADAEAVDVSWIGESFRLMSDDSDMRGGVFILEGQSTDFNSNGVAVENIYLIDRDGNEVATFRPEDVYDYVSPMGQDHNGDDLVMIQYKKGVSTFEGGTKVYKIDHINKTLIPLEEYTVSQNHMTGRTYIDDAGTFRPALIYTISSGVRKNQLGLGSSPVSGVDQNQMMSYRDGSDTLQYKQLAAEALSAINDDDEQFSGTPNSNIAIYSHHDPGDNVGTLRNCHTGYLCRTGTGADDSPRPFYCFQANTNTTAVTYHSRSHVSRVMPSGAFVAVFRGVLDTGSNSHSFVKIFPALLNEADHDTVMGGSAPD